MSSSFLCRLCAPRAFSQLCLKIMPRRKKAHKAAKSARAEAQQSTHHQHRDCATTARLYVPCQQTSGEVGHIGTRLTSKPRTLAIGRLGAPPQKELGYKKKKNTTTPGSAKWKLMGPIPRFFLFRARDEASLGNGA